MINNNWKYLISFIFGIVIGIIINLPGCQPEEKIEYIKIHDKSIVTKDKIIEKTKIVNVVDTFIKVDSVYIRKDGTYVQMPIEYKTYKDTLKTDSSYANITINYSGINSNIDSYVIDFTYSQRQITKIQKPKRFGIDLTIGLYCGYGIHGTMSNPMTFGRGPEIGIGFCIGPSYRITK